MAELGRAVADEAVVERNLNERVQAALANVPKYVFSDRQLSPLAGATGVVRSSVIVSAPDACVDPNI